METEESVPSYTRSDKRTTKAVYYDTAYDIMADRKPNPSLFVSSKLKTYKNNESASSCRLDVKKALFLQAQPKQSSNHDFEEKIPALAYNPKGWIRDLWGLIFYISITAFLFGVSIYVVATDDRNPKLWNLFYKTGEKKVLPKMAENVLYFLATAVAYLGFFVVFSHLHKRFPKFCLHASFAASLAIAPLYLTLILTLKPEADKKEFFWGPFCIFILIAYFVLRKKFEINSELLCDGLEKFEENPGFPLAMMLFDFTMAVFRSIHYSFLIYVPASFIGYDSLIENRTTHIPFQLLLKTTAFVLVASFHSGWTLQICILTKNSFVALVLEKEYKQRTGKHSAHDFISDMKSILQNMVRSSGTICCCAFLMTLVRSYQIYFNVFKAGKKRFNNAIGYFCKLIYDCFCKCFDEIFEKANNFSLINAVRHGDSFWEAATITKSTMLETGLRCSFSLATINVSYFLATCSLFFAAFVPAFLILPLFVVGLKENVTDDLFLKFDVYLSFVFILMNLFMLFVITNSYFASVVASLGLLLCEDPKTCKLEYPKIWNILKKTKPTAAAVQAYET